MSKSPPNDTHWAGIPVTVKSLYHNLEGGEKSIKGCTLQLQLLHGKATELLYKGKSVFYFHLTGCHICLIILITCFISNHLISLFSIPVSSSYKDTELSSGGVHLPPRIPMIVAISLFSRKILYELCTAWIGEGGLHNSMLWEPQSCIFTLSISQKHHS